MTHQLEFSNLSYSYSYQDSAHYSPQGHVIAPGSVPELRQQPLADPNDALFKWRCSGTDRELIENGQAHRMCNPRVRITVNGVNPCVPVGSVEVLDENRDVEPMVPASSLEVRNYGAQECTGDQRIYDELNMEHLDFTNPSLQDTCSHPDPATRPPAKIPKIVHYIFGLQPDFGGHPFLFLNFMSIKMAHDSIKPDEIIVHYYYEPKGIWWEKTKPYVTLQKINKIPDEIFGNPVEDYAHRADVLRMQILMKHGGIYLDSDVFIYRSLDPLLHHEFVMAREDFHGMANAFMLASNDSRFLKEWYGRYKNFDDRVWSEHSVLLPLRMLGEMPDTICALPRFIHTKDEYIFQNSFQYGYHTFNHKAFNYLIKTTPDFVRSYNSSFTRLLRPFLDDSILGNDSGYVDTSSEQ
ncbi:hypothetical protein HDU76_012854 [Blyttiomyces sp. JEL0837]|nr:hypothetical protein HDU76_012854 [Blyttiomyces sp. JEL0837]